MSETQLLRELHETYVWEVNAAVEEGRMDLVRELADEYSDEALRLMAASRSPGCGRPDCAICGAARPAPPPAPTSPPPRRRWSSWVRLGRDA